MLRNRVLLLVASASAFAWATQAAHAATVIGQWTFETSLPTTAGPISPEVGAGSATGSHAGAAVYSNPVGNGSAESYSANVWAVGDYYMFQVSTTGLSGISVEWDQTSSNTGPKDFELQHSTNGTTFTPFATYVVLANGGSPNVSWNGTTFQSAYHYSYDLSSITALDNQGSIYLRMTNTSTVSATGATVAPAGTDRVDNVTISAVPEPATIALLVLGAGLMHRRRQTA